MTQMFASIRALEAPRTLAIWPVALGLALTAFGTKAAFAHGGLPAEAILITPSEMGTVADQSIEITWIDSDNPIPTGTATVNLFYTDAMPPTFEPGTRPDALIGTPMVSGIFEYDDTNSYTWDTSAVSAGTYWVWSLVEEPPEPMPSPQIIRFTEVPIVVAHGQDEVPPAVRITNPDNPFVWADQTVDLEYEAFDPSGTGRVRLEVGSTFDGSDFTVIAEDLPAVAEGSFTWDTSQLAEVDWTIRATIIDDRGFEITAYAQYFLLVTHLQAPDAGPSTPDAGAAEDMGTPQAPDAGVDVDQGQKMMAKEGCSCTGSSQRPGLAWLMLLFIAAPLIRWRS